MRVNTHAKKYVVDILLRFKRKKKWSFEGFEHPHSTKIKNIRKYARLVNELISLFMPFRVTT